MTSMTKQTIFKTSSLMTSDISLGKLSDTSKDFKELNNEINKAINTNKDVLAQSGYDSSALGFSDSTWINSRDKQDNSENFNEKVEEVKNNKFSYFNAKTQGDKPINSYISPTKIVTMITNPINSDNHLINEYLQKSKEKEKEKEKREEDESNVDSVGNDE